MNDVIHDSDPGAWPEHRCDACGYPHTPCGHVSPDHDQRPDHPRVPEGGMDRDGGPGGAGRERGVQGTGEPYPGAVSPLARAVDRALRAAYAGAQTVPIDYAGPVTVRITLPGTIDVTVTEPWSISPTR